MFPEFNRLFINKALEDIIGELDLFVKTREQSDRFLEDEWPKLEQGVERKGPYGDRPDTARSEMAMWRQTLRNREESDEALEVWFDPRNKEMTQEALDILHKAKADIERQKNITDDFEKFLKDDDYDFDDVSDDDWSDIDFDDSPLTAQEIEESNDAADAEMYGMHQSEKDKWSVIDQVLGENPERDPNKPIYLPDERRKNWTIHSAPDYAIQDYLDEAQEAEESDAEWEKMAKQLAKEEGQGWILKAITSGRIPAVVALALIGTLWSEPAY